MLPEFELLRPTHLAEALEMLAEGGAAPIAGGTNLIADLRAGHRNIPARLIDLARVTELAGIRSDDGRLVIGGTTTISSLLRSPLVAGRAVALAEAARVFANPLIRNRATVGGNLADASPAADTAPPLLALDASVELASSRGTRRIPLADFLVGVRKTLRQPDELITGILLPGAEWGGRSAFAKFGLRRADAISVLSAAVAGEFAADGRCKTARIALGAVAPRPIRAPEAERVLCDEKWTPQVIAEAARLAAGHTSPIDDIRGSAAYRRHVTEVIVRRLLKRVAAGGSKQ